MVKESFAEELLPARRSGSSPASSGAKRGRASRQREEQAPSSEL